MQYIIDVLIFPECYITRQFQFSFPCFTKNLKPALTRSEPVCLCLTGALTLYASFIGWKIIPKCEFDVDANIIILTVLLV